MTCNSKRVHKSISEKDASTSEGHGDRSLSPQCLLDLEGVLFKILTLLPLRKIFELRLVCKAWNALLRSPSFLHQWSATPHPDLLVMVKYAHSCPASRQCLVAFDVASGHWISLLPLLVSCLHPRRSTLLCGTANAFEDVEVPCLSAFQAIGGAPGVVCFLSSSFLPSTSLSSFHEDDLWPFVPDPHVCSLAVLNLFTGSYRLLPTPPKHHEGPAYHCGSIFLQPLPNGGYRILRQHHWWSSVPGPLEIYDFPSGTWKIGKACWGSSDAKIATVDELKGADFLKYTQDTRIMFAYSIELDEWSQVCVESPQQNTVSSFDGTGDIPGQFLGRYTLCRCNGRVLLAAAKWTYSFFAGFAVWELCVRHSEPPVSEDSGDAPMADWMEVARTPQELWQGLNIAEGEENGVEEMVNIIFSGSLICMTACLDRGDEGVDYPALAYDVFRDVWFHLPPYNEDNSLVAAFCLQPSFTAMA